MNKKLESVLKKKLRVTMPDGSRWDVPVKIIAENRAYEYRSEYRDEKESLEKDTLPLFASDDYEIQDWAANNLLWEDVKELATKVEDAAVEVDYEEGWTNGEKEIIA